MKLFVYEHVAGGGFAGQDIPSSVLSEGFGMLRALISDFKAAGHNVMTTLDVRLKELKPPIKADTIISISSGQELNKTLERNSPFADAVYIIAPESGQVLRRLVEAVRKAGGISLNCSVNAIEKASNKMTVYKAAKKTGLSVPETLIAKLNENMDKIEHAGDELRLPLVFKPVNGVGCSGLSVVKNKLQMRAAVNKIMKKSESKQFLVQKLIDGSDVSVSLISTGTKALPLTLNRQIMHLTSPSSDSHYLGGIVPFHHALENDALETAKKLVERFKDFRGYVGVDMVLTEDGPVVMEVNPRLTTSYIGLRKVVNFNPAQAMIDAVLRRRLPEDVRVSGYTFFSKVKVSAPTSKVLQETYRLKELASPPFPFTDDGTAWALIVAHAARLRDARTGFHRAKRSLMRILLRDD